jgi:hypothetical protein
MRFLRYDSASDELTRLGPLGQPEKAIGHEPQIEPWLAPDNRFACRFQNGMASSQLHDENRWE